MNALPTCSENSPYSQVLDEICQAKASLWRKMDYIQQFKIESLIAVHGLSRILFITLGFADPQPDYWAAKARLDRFLRGSFFKAHVELYLWAFEYGDESGNPHFHLVCLMRWDVGRDQFNFESLKVRGVRSNACQALEDFWRGSVVPVSKRFPRGRGISLADACVKAGFGSFPQAVPVKDGLQAARYLGGYFAKDARANRFRAGHDKRRYFGSSQRCPGHAKGSGKPKFMWNSPFAWVWRQKVRLWLELHPDRESWLFPAAGASQMDDALWSEIGALEGWGAPSDCQRQGWRDLGFKAWNSLDLISLPQPF